jgi:hypothetical protein
MSNQLEARIRDYLAAHLDDIETGLTLVQAELTLPGAFGAGGVVDILARDRFGHVVVIEIKRSDQSARAALHELSKYAALLKTNQGVPEDRMRALLISTSWHELAASFTEYQRCSRVPLEGLVIEAEEDGRVTSMKPFVAAEPSEPLEISSAQDCVLFGNRDHRDNALNRFVSAARRTRLRDFCILSLDHTGGDPTVIHPHGLYLVFSSPMNASKATSSAIKRALSWDSEIGDENFLVGFREALGIIGDESPSVGPEKLSQLSAWWRISVAHREGRYASNATVLPDNEIIADARRSEGGASYYLERMVSPKYSPSWKSLLRDLKLVLEGISEWEEIFPLVLAEIARKHPEASVSVRAYNFADIVYSLARFGVEQDLRYMPSVEVLVSGPSGNVFYAGVLVWDGDMASTTAREWVESAYGSTERYVSARGFGMSVVYDGIARALLGVCAAVYEIADPGGPHQSITALQVGQRSLVRDSVEPGTVRFMDEFGYANAAFLAELVHLFQSFSVG